MAERAAKKWFINGRVQGVGFRYFVERTAKSLGLAGWTRNLDDGRVEVYATGGVAELKKLGAALHLGPRLAEVRGVEEHEEEQQRLSDFTIR